MKIIDEIYPNLTTPKELKLYTNSDKILFFDIETTGLKKETTSLYLIGCGYYKDGILNTKFFFGESPDEELQLLEVFFEFVNGYDYIVHFNGTKFDLPYLEYKSKLYKIDNPLQSICSIDIYQEIKPLRYLLFRESMKQKSVEDFLGIKRNDQYNGGELIPIYLEYVNSKDDYNFSLLMMHNREDILGMHQIFPIINYLYIKDMKLIYMKYETITYSDFYGNEQKELLIDYKYDINLPVSFTIVCNDIYYKFDAANNQLKIRIPLCLSDMYHYYENFKDYYYILKENICVHKSISASVDKNEREKATKDNCRIIVNGLILPQFSHCFELSCGPEYKSRLNYFVLTKEPTVDFWQCYGYHILNTLLTNKPKRKKKIINENQV